MGHIKFLVLPAILIALTVACSSTPSAPAPAASPATKSEVHDTTVMPAVKGFYKGQEIQFIQTEASYRGVAEMRAQQIGGRQVLVVPQLAQVPTSVLTNVYAFTNGVKGPGPFGSQADVFDSAPGDERYSPLCALHFVTWKEGVTARELRSVEEIKAAESRGEVTARFTGHVVNMPMLTWPGGSR